MPTLSRHHDLLPVLGLVVAAVFSFWLKPSALLPWVFLMMAVGLSLLWWRRPIRYQRWRAGMARVLLALSWLLTFPVLLLSYFLILTPLALFLRWTGRDALGLRQTVRAAGSAWRKPLPRVHDDAFFRAQF